MRASAWTSAVMLAATVLCDVLGSTQPSASRVLSCRVPDAILHNACIRSVTVRVRPSGLCAVSFVSACSPQTSLGKPAAASGWRRDHASRSPACFRFNGQEVCE